MEQISSFPPVLQLLALTVLGLYVVVSVLGRLVPAMHFVWRDPHLIRDRAHVATYTLMPLLVFAGLAIAVSAHWDPSIPWHGGWPIEDLVTGPGLLITSLTLIVLSQVLGKMIDISDARRLTSWIPLLLMVSAIAMMVVGVLTLTGNL
ncbi:MAG: hypothetical protein KY432_01325 [Acidobacteria bacterium]|nr:hypothetical protein [Acidobacteriota bacterium]